YFGIDTGFTTPERQEKDGPSLGGKLRPSVWQVGFATPSLAHGPKSRKALVVPAGELKNPARSVREPERGLWTCALMEDAPEPARRSSAEVQFTMARAHPVLPQEDPPARPAPFVRMHRNTRRQLARYAVLRVFDLDANGARTRAVKDGGD